MYSLLPLHGRITFKTLSGVVITTAKARWGPLTSDFSGLEVDASEIKNTAIFICFGFSQRFLTSRVVDQGHLIYVKSGETYLIQSLKDHGSHTEFVGLRYTPPTTAGGIVAEYAFRTAGTKLLDETGNNSLSNIGSATWQDDRPSEVVGSLGAVEFGGADHFEISDANQVGLDITGAITIACRVKLFATAGNQALVAKDGAAASRGYKLYLASAVPKCDLSNDGTAVTTATGLTVLNGNQWYSLAVVYNGTDIRLYVNGVLDSNGASNPKAYTAGIVNSSQKFYLAARSNDSEFLNGRLCHVFIFNEAKTAAEIASWHSGDAW